MPNPSPRMRDTAMPARPCPQEGQEGPLSPDKAILIAAERWQVQIVELRPGDRFHDLAAAQQAGFGPLVDLLAATLAQLLASGALVVDGGQLVPADERARG